MNKLLVLSSILLLQSCGFSFVETGSVGVRTSMGKVVESGIPEGIVFHTPFSNTIHDVDVTLQSLNVTTEAYTKDIQQVTVGLTINYFYNPTQSEYIFRNGNKDYAAKIITPVVLEKLKEQVGKYQAEELISKRDEVGRKLNVDLKESLNGYHINLSQITLGNFDFSDVFEKSIESKQVALQRAKEAANKTEEVLQQKAQQILIAQGEAESMKIKANALVQNKNLIEYEAIQRWDGKLPQYMLGNSTPFINVK